MKYLLTLSFLLVFGLQGAFSQSDFRNGYVITNSNDTIYGLVEHKDHRSNAKKCVFKTDENAEQQVFTPHQIKGYRFIDGKYYVARTYKNEKTERLTFVEFLINAIVDVYHFRDADGEHYLIDNGDGNLTELEYKKELVTRNGDLYMKQPRKYIGLLKLAFKDSPKITQKVEDIRISHKSLIKVTEDYHKEVCSADEECIIYEKQLPKIIPRFGLLLGVNFFSISTYDYLDEFYYLRDSQLDKVYPSVGFFYTINLPYENERVHLQYEGVFSHAQSNTVNVSYSGSNDVKYTNDIRLTQSSYKSDLFLRYKLPGERKIYPTLQAGGFFNYAFRLDYKRTVDTEFQLTELSYLTEFDESPLTRFDYGLSLGIGLMGSVANDKSIFLDLKYQKGFGLMWGIDTNNILLNVGYQIGK